LLIVASVTLFARAADSEIDYLQPALLTGTIYSDASLKQVLFTFRRTAINSGSTVRVMREFNLPDGTAVARENVVYEGGQLKSLSLEELQSGAKGNALVESGAGGRNLNFNYTQGGTKKSGSEKLVNDTLVNDMVGPFIVSHWDALARGATVRCRFVAVSRAETVGFKLFKESETTWRGKSVLIVKMEPSSLIIAQLVAPLHFFIEEDGAHRVLQYIGRTTPSVLKNGKWEDLDAVTVFNW
jgi:hypothetical protein